MQASNNLPAIHPFLRELEGYVLLKWESDQERQSGVEETEIQHRIEGHEAPEWGWWIFQDNHRKTIVNQDDEMYRLPDVSDHNKIYTSKRECEANLVISI